MRAQVNKQASWLASQCQPAAVKWLISTMCVNTFGKWHRHRTDGETDGWVQRVSSPPTENKW